MLKKILIFLAVFIFLLTTLYANEKVVKLVTLGDYAPFCFIKEGARDTIIDEMIPPGKDSKILQGYTWDMARESYHAVGYTISLTVVPWVRGMKLIENGRVDLIFPAVKTSERLEKYIFAKKPVDIQPFHIYVQKDDDLEWNGLESLKRKTVGTMIDWSYGEKFANANYFEKDASSQIMHGFNKLKAGRIDAVVGYGITYDYELQKEGQIDNFKKLPEFDYLEEFLIGLKNAPNVQELLDAFDEGMEAIIESGLYDEINSKWLAD
jgi:ABC-type amino acid transport substrate-binding protein